MYTFGTTCQTDQTDVCVFPVHGRNSSRHGAGPYEHKTSVAQVRRLQESKLTAYTG